MSSTGRRQVECFLERCLAKESLPEESAASGFLPVLCVCVCVCVRTNQLSEGRKKRAARAAAHLEARRRLYLRAYLAKTAAVSLKRSEFSSSADLAAQRSQPTFAWRTSIESEAEFSKLISAEQT